ncbi:hypothetical protein IVB12_15280 [Bradyrhizobium sp. 179]|uniref:hypothetical protein n=1 Tax=Bradyrhizobium sp. 179 TaxID=2782648 RepID=UPI001FF90271|nr:hypothetical protein [Bradyrhizobium sp. 179]MCK1543277.1 hypothetical protein [Bradyrhizobium sp. 179]
MGSFNVAFAAARSQAFAPGARRGKGKNKVGGYAIGDQGASGSVYEGFTLSWADDFTALDIVGPTTPKAKYFPTKSYGSGIRGNQTSSGTAQETDPLWTGHNDVNRGVAAGISNMSVQNSVLHLGARNATPAEQALFTPGVSGGVRPQVSAMIHTAGAVGFYPSTNAVVVEWRAAFTGPNPAGWHPTLWIFSTMLRAANGTEIDFEGSSTGLYTEIIDHTNGTITPQNSNGPSSYFDGVMRTYTIVIQNAASGGTGPVKFYVDGVLKQSYAHDGNAHGMPHTALLTSHILNANYNGDTYSSAAWAASTTPSEMLVDYMRVWRKTGVTHWKPLVSVPDLNVAYNGSGSITLPSAATLWGDASVLEEVQVVPYDAAEPGMGTQSYYTTNLPPNVTYDAPSRTLTANFASDTTGAGRLHVVVYGYKADGSTMEPLRFAINRGPNITATSLQPVPAAGGGSSCDVYFTADVGTIFPKSFSFTGLPAGWSFNPATATLSASTGASGGTVTMTVTNGVGQTASKSIDIWSPAVFGSNLVFAWDTTSTASMHDDGSGKVDYLADIYTSTKRIAQSTTTARPLAATNGGPGANKRFISFISNGLSLRSDDAAAGSAGAITSFADTADVRTGNRYICWASKETSTGVVNRVLGWFNTAGSQFLGFRHTTTGRGAAIQANGGSQQTTDQATNDTNWHVWEVIWNGASLVVKMDGTQIGAVTITQTGGIAANLFILGGSQAGGAFIGGIGPGLFTSTVPSASDQTYARKWVATKMGITVS